MFHPYLVQSRYYYYFFRKTSEDENGSHPVTISARGKGEIYFLKVLRKKEQRSIELT